MVVVVKPDELAKTEMPREGGGLVGNALHQVAVAADKPGAVIDDPMPVAVERGREVRFSDGHADGVRQALAERTRRRLNAGRVAVLRVPLRHASPLPKPL